MTGQMTGRDTQSRQKKIRVVSSEHSVRTGYARTLVSRLCKRLPHVERRGPHVLCKHLAYAKYEIREMLVGGGRLQIEYLYGVWYYVGCMSRCGRNGCCDPIPTDLPHLSRAPTKVRYSARYLFAKSMGIFYGIPQAGVVCRLVEVSYTYYHRRQTNDTPGVADQRRRTTIGVDDPPPPSYVDPVTHPYIFGPRKFGAKCSGDFVTRNLVSRLYHAVILDLLVSFEAFEPK